MNKIVENVVIGTIATIVSVCAVKVGGALYMWHTIKCAKEVEKLRSSALDSVEKIHDDIKNKIISGEKSYYPRVSEDAHLVVDDATSKEICRDICIKDLYARRCSAETLINEYAILVETETLSLRTATRLIDLAVRNFEEGR